MTGQAKGDLLIQVTA